MCQSFTAAVRLTHHTATGSASRHIRTLCDQSLRSLPPGQCLRRKKPMQCMAGDQWVVSHCTSPAPNCACSPVTIASSLAAKQVQTLYVSHASHHGSLLSFHAAAPCWLLVPRETDLQQHQAMLLAALTCSSTKPCCWPHSPAAAAGE